MTITKLQPSVRPQSCVQHLSLLRSLPIDKSLVSSLLMSLVWVICDEALRQFNNQPAIS